MLRRSHRTGDRVEKTTRVKRSFKDTAKASKLQRSMEESSPNPNTLTSPIITFMVGRESRLFAAHQDVLSQSPFFVSALRGAFLDASGHRINLLDEEPEVFSCVLEYLYKGDYYPRLLCNKRQGTWSLEDAELSTPANAYQSNSDRAVNGRGSSEAVIYLASVGERLLRDSVIYCAAERYGLEGLKTLALRKQGLQSGIEVGMILRSARYVYDNTPDTDSRLRAHYIALIIRCRKTFKRSGTMQAEMEGGGKLFFDLFVALCNHVDDIVDVGNSRSPKTI